LEKKAGQRRWTGEAPETAGLSVEMRSNNRKGGVAWWSARGLLAGLVALMLADSAVAIERKVPTVERKPPSDRMTTADAHYELGLVYHERMFADLDQAIAEYEQAVKLRSDFAEAHYHLGLSYHTKAKLGSDDKTTRRSTERL
jgi:hypothetical protein